MISIIGTASCLRFDIAVPLPEDEGDGANLLVMALASCAATSLIVGATFMLLPDLLAELLNQAALRSYRWLIPIGVFLVGSFSALQAWFVRRRQFAAIAQARVSQSLVGAGLQIGLGWMGIAPFGLMLGQIMTSAGGSMTLGARMGYSRKAFTSLVSLDRMRELLSIYRRFPTYSTLECLFNTGGMQIPVVMIVAMAEGPEAGYLMLAMSIMQAPIALLGTSVAQVYASRAPSEHREGSLGGFTLNVYRGLLKSGAGMLIFAGIVAPSVFGIVFGSGWGRAGVLVAWMTPWFVMQFLVVPVSVALHVTDHLRVAFALQTFGLVIRVVAITAATKFAPTMVAETYSLSGFIFYLIYLIVVLRVVGASWREVTRCTVRALPLVAGWVIAAILAVWVFQPVIAMVGHILGIRW